MIINPEDVLILKNAVPRLTLKAAWRSIVVNICPSFGLLRKVVSFEIILHHQCFINFKHKS